MANLLRYLVELAHDRQSRDLFRTDPAAEVARIGAGVEGGITGEDVRESALIAFHLIDRAIVDHLEGIDHEAIGNESPADAAARLLTDWCDRVDHAPLAAPTGHVPGADAVTAGADGAGDATVVSHGDGDGAGDGAGDEMVSGEDTAAVEDPASGDGQAGDAPVHGATWGRSHLRAVPSEAADEPGTGGPTIDPEHPAVAESGGSGRSLSAVPSIAEDDAAPDDAAPDGAGAAIDENEVLSPVAAEEATFRVLEMVILPDGIPEAEIEPGAIATVVAVHTEPELGYEIEVSAEDGARRYLGIVPARALAEY